MLNPRAFPHPYLLLLITAIALYTTVGTANAALSPIRVSGDSPFAECTTASYGTLYGNAEAEPSVASNPANPSNLVGVWQQDRWSNGAARGLAAAYSLDDGASWTETVLPFTTCAQQGLPYDRASDPWVSFGPDGTAYASAIVLGKDGSNAVVAATSIDGGKTWGNAREVIVDGRDSRQFFNDKSSITADPTTPGVAYVVWARLASGGEGDQESGAQDGAPKASAYLARTGDGGQTWSEPKAITDENAGEATGNQIVVDPRTGVLYDFFDLIAQGGRGRLTYTIGFVKSLDGGETWSQPKTVSDIRNAPVRVPGTRQTVRAGGILPAAAIDQSAGTLYVVWMDSRFADGQYPEVAISISDDDGNSWSTPARVNTPSDGPAFTPSVSVSAGGTVAVTYYDFRSYRIRSSPVLADSVPGARPALWLASVAAQAASLPTDYWATFSTDGGETFGGEVHIAGTFDILAAPNSGGYFLGDYQGLTTGNDSFVAFFVQAASGDRANRTDVFALPLVEPKPSYIDVH